MKRKSRKVDTGSDGITNLPELVIDQILCALPIKDAFRTSILSRTWRYQWRGISDLVFDNGVVSAKANQNQTLVSDKLVKIVDHILLLRNAPIRKFEMRHESLIASCNIDRWILRLSESPIEELILEIPGKRQYTMPSCFFGSESLTCLELSNCFLKPPTFGGFRKMKELHLQTTTVSQADFEVLIAKCPLLERLTLWETHGFTHLNIEAPNLKYIDVDGAFNHISFLNTFQLAEVNINMATNVESDVTRVLRSSNSLQEFFNELPQVRSLAIYGFFAKYLAVLQTAGSLSRPCKNVSYLYMGIDFGDFEEISVLLCLLESSPNLEELQISVECYHVQQGFVGRQFDDCVNYESSRVSFRNLRHVEIIDIFGCSHELNFIEFLLSNSPILEKIMLKPSSTCTEAQQIGLLRALLRFRQVSNAEIIYMDPTSSA